MKNLKLRIMERETNILNKSIERFKEELAAAGENLTYTEKYMDRKTIYIKDREQKVIKRLQERSKRNIGREFKRIDEINSASDNLDRTIVMNITFYKNRTWGYCPIAEDNHGHKSGSITGCGYDKESTASAEILNCHPIILKKMYKIKNDNINKKNGELFGYGSGSYLLPSFESGVGIDCHINMLEKLGYKVEKFSTNTSTVLTISED